MDIRRRLPLTRIARLASIAGFVVAALLLLAPRSAEACSCVGGIDLIQPSDGASEVPTNARIWIGDRILFWQYGGTAESPDIELRDEAGAPVSFSASTLGANRASVLVLTPDELLKPEGTYSIVLLVDTGDEPEHVLSTFTVGSGPIESPPSPPTVTVVETKVESMGETDGAACGPFHYARLEIGGPEGAVIVLLDEGRRAEVRPEAPAAIVTSLSTGGMLRIGAGVCDEPWPDAAPGAQTEVRVAAFDIAGNFSGFGEFESVELPRFGTKSCQTAGGAAPLAGLVMMGGLLFWAARRRRSL